METSEWVHQTLKLNGFIVEALRHFSAIRVCAIIGHKRSFLAYQAIVAQLSAEATGFLQGFAEIIVPVSCDGRCV